MSKYSIQTPLIGAAAFASAIVLTGLASSAWAQATVYRCTGPGGVVEYGNAAPRKDQQCEKIALPAITTVKAGAKLPAKASKPKKKVAKTNSESAKNFPKVDGGTQSKRDDDRNRLLQDELGREEKRLSSLRLEYKNGEPDRRGDERNYQRYLDRVEKMKADIARTEGNVDALRRELASAKN
jgi:hypothetical protein